MDKIEDMTNLFDDEEEDDHELPLKNAKFDGPVYEPIHDKIRLTGQIQRVYHLIVKELL